MHNDQSSLLSAGNLSGRRSHSCSRSPSRSCSWSQSCSSSRSYDIHYVAQDDRKPSTLPNRWYSYSSKSDDSGRIHYPDKCNTVFATFSAPMATKCKRTPKKMGITLAENSCVPLYVFVPDMEPDFLTDSHVKLDIFVDTQEPLNTSHHKVAFEYDEDTVSLVEEQTLSILDVSLSNNSNSSAGNASTAFEYECYEIEDDMP